MQMPVNTIVAATDFSAASGLAVQRAAQLARTLGARLSVVHAMERSLMHALRDLGGGEQVQQRLDALVDDLAADSAGTISARILEGSVVRAVAGVASECDLLVLGARGSHKMREFALGATARRILYRSKVPTLVVRREATRAYRKVLIATDFSRQSLRAARFVVEMLTDADIMTVHVYQAPYEMSMSYADVSEEVIHEYRAKARDDGEIQMRRFIREAGLTALRTEPRLEPGYAPRVLSKLAADSDADLLVIGKQGRSRLGGLLFGSVTEHLLTEANCDVLVVQ